MSVISRALCAAILLLAMTAEAFAYGGPGAAITLIGSLVGVGLAILASLFYVIIWPLRRMMKKRRPDEGAEAKSQITEGTSSGDTPKAMADQAQGQ